MENLLPEASPTRARTRPPARGGRGRVLAGLLAALFCGCGHAGYSNGVVQASGHGHGHGHDHDHGHGHGHGHDHDHDHGHEDRRSDVSRCAHGARVANLSGVSLSRRDADGLASIGIALVPHALAGAQHGAAHAHSQPSDHGQGAAHVQAGGGQHGHDDRFRYVEACGRAVLAIDGEHTEGWYLRGLVRLDSHDFAGALRFADQVLRRRADHVGALLLASDARLERRELREAEQLVERALDVKPCLPALVRAGHLRHLQGDDARAKQLYAAALRMGLQGGDRDGAVWAATEAAKLFLAAGDARGAEAGFDLALRIRPDAVEARRGRARARLAQVDHP